MQGSVLIADAFLCSYCSHITAASLTVAAVAMAKSRFHLANTGVVLVGVDDVGV